MVCIHKIVTFTVDINQAINNMASWVEPRGYHVGMDGPSKGGRGGARREALLERGGIAVG